MNLKRIDAAIANYRTAGISIDDAARLDFFRALWGALDEHLRETKTSGEADRQLPAYAAPDAGTIKRAEEREQPVFEVAPVTIKTKLLAECVGCLLATTAKSKVFPDDATRAIMQVSWQKLFIETDMQLAGRTPGVWLDDLVERLISSGLAAAHARLAALLVSLALKVQLEKPAQLIMKARGAYRLGSTHPLLCPVCGSSPMMGHVGEHSASVRGRMLVCSQCGSAWDFERVRCARCGTRNQAHLHFYHIGDDEAHRLEICDECDGYLRVLYSEDALALCVYEVEDVIMARLDALAHDPRVRNKTNKK